MGYSKNGWINFEMFCCSCRGIEAHPDVGLAVANGIHLKERLKGSASACVNGLLHQTPLHE